MTTKAAPVFCGSALNIVCSAWTPPAEAPTATITGSVVEGAPVRDVGWLLPPTFSSFAITRPIN